MFDVNVLKIRYWIMIFIVISFAVYGNTFRNQWTYDDIPVVVENTDSQSLAGFVQNSRPGRPMRELTFVLDHALFGNDPAGYHLQQILWHFANGVLLLALFLMLGVKPLYASLAVIIFLVHPLQSESVANISHRKELLALFFALASIIFYIKSSASKGWRYLTLISCCLLSFAGAVLSNQTAITAPLVIILFEILYLSKAERIVTRRPGLLFGVLLLAAMYFGYMFRGLFSRNELLSIYSKNSFIASKSFLPLWMADLKAFGFYLYKIMVPINLAPEYTFAFSEEIFQPWALCSALVLLFLIYLAVVNRINNPTLSFGIGWFFIFYLPVSNVLPVAYMVADRYMYLALPGVSLIIAFLLQKYDSVRLTILATALILVFASLCVVQNSYWKDEHTLWRHAVKVNPDSTWVQETVALSYLLSNEFEKARSHAKKAIELNRYNSRAYLTLAKAEDRLGNLEMALKYFELFKSFGFMEYPEEAAKVERYLPVLKERVRKQKILINGRN